MERWWKRRKKEDEVLERPESDRRTKGEAKVEEEMVNGSLCLLVPSLKSAGIL